MKQTVAGPRFVKLSEVQADRRLSEAWDRIVAEGRFNASLGLSWFSVIVDSLAVQKDAIEVLVWEQPFGGVAALIPFYRSVQSYFGIRQKTLEVGSNLMSYHAELVAEGNEQSLIEALLNGRPGWDVFRFANVVQESKTARAIREVGKASGMYLQVLPGQESPYLEIQGTWEQYLASRHKKFRYKLRQRRHRLLVDSRAELRWFETAKDAERLIEDILAVEKKSWKSQAGLAIVGREPELAYHRKLLPVLAQQGALLASVLYLGGVPIAYSLCCHFSGWVGHLKTSFDQSHANSSPGGLVVDACVERAFRIGAREFDFLGDAAPHKLAWTSTTRKHADFFLFGATLTGRILGGAKRINDRLRAGRTPGDQS